MSRQATFNQYRPIELEPIFNDALKALITPNCSYIHVLENLCKDFLKTVIMKQSYQIQLSTLVISTKGDGPSSLEQANQKYNSLVSHFTDMRKEYTKEVLMLKEGQQTKIKDPRLMLQSAQANIFEDMQHLIVQTKLCNGSKAKNPDYLSPSAQTAIQKKF